MHQPVRVKSCGYGKGATPGQQQVRLNEGGQGVRGVVGAGSRMVGGRGRRVS